MSLDAYFAGDVLARVILRVLDSVEANGAEIFVVERRLLCFFGLLCLRAFDQRAVIAIDRVVPDLLAHDQLFRLRQHPDVRFKDADFILISGPQLIENDLEQSLKEGWIEGAHAVDQVGKRIVLGHRVVVRHGLSDLLVHVDTGLFFIVILFPGLDLEWALVQSRIETDEVW